MVVFGNSLLHIEPYESVLSKLALREVNKPTWHAHEKFE